VAQIFSKTANRVPLYILGALALLLAALTGFFWYYGSPKFTDVGYRPVQPVPYSHKLHAGDLGMDCRYCHNQVEFSRHANIPSVKVCMNCHGLIGQDNPRLLPLRESWASGAPLQWIRVHNLPDFVYFDHSAHLYAGVGCRHCHGRVDQMEAITQSEPLSMSWCLNCHRRPEPYIGPPEEITNMLGRPDRLDAEALAQLMRDRNISPDDECSLCHR
jgi:hypothetical protein